MFEVILACTKDYGIGKDNTLPWHCPDEMKIFKEKTMGGVLIVGRKTLESFPASGLAGRRIIRISKSQDWNTSFTCAKSFEDALNLVNLYYPNERVFVAGGSQIYDIVFKNYKHLISKLHVSVMNEQPVCDTFIRELSLPEWGVLEKVEHKDFTHYVMTYSPGESGYLQLIRDIPRDFRQTRNGETASVFGKHLTFDLSCGFPLLTTKKMFFKGIVEELLFFIRGETDTKVLESKGINIWKGNTDRAFLDSLGMTQRKEGLMGPMYGYQWRFFDAQYDETTGKNLTPGTDQLALVVDLIRRDPNSRRIIMTSFNPSQAFAGVLYPCHSLTVQFYVRGDFLDMFCYNRSQDLFLGTPFNIASSALLLTLIAKITNKTPGTLHMSLGDVHIYKNHYELALEQVNRQPYAFPAIEISKDIREISDIEKLTFQDFTLKNYKHHPAMKAEMVA
jgi:dihydrofolate reductase / thymidylate synthase